MSIEEYFNDWMPYINKSLLLNTIQRVDYNNVTPNPKDWFKCFELCPYKKFNTLILCQDPYPQRDIATGVALANKKDTINISPSLDIIKNSCINLYTPKNNINFDLSLEGWCEQGILLLNASLTTKIGYIGAHTNIWRPFIKDFLIKLNTYNTGIIYVLLGDVAKTFKPFINSKFNYILEEKHPSYYARNNMFMPNTIFKEIQRINKLNNNTNIKFYEEVLV